MTKNCSPFAGKLGGFGPRYSHLPSTPVFMLELAKHQRNYFDGLDRLFSRLPLRCSRPHQRLRPHQRYLSFPILRLHLLLLFLSIEVADAASLVRRISSGLDERVVHAMDADLRLLSRHAVFHSPMALRKSKNHSHRKMHD